MPKAPAISISGSVISSARTFWSDSRSRRWLMASKRSCSWRSRPNAFTIFVPVNASWRRTASWATRSWARLLILYRRRPTMRTMSAMKGNATSAHVVSTHSRVNITTSSATIVPACRTAMTSNPEEIRDSRLTSVSTRDMRSAEWTPAKNDSGMPWMWI